MNTRKQDLTAAVRTLLAARGASIVGFADLAPLPADMRGDLPRGVCLGVALNPSIVAGMEGGPTAAYAREYEQVNVRLDELAAQAAAFLTARGFRALAGAATVETLDWTRLRTPLPHKSVATLAGVGWIGKCAVLVTEAFGSAVRLNGVLTDAPLTTGVPVTASRCGACDACVAVCPAQAPTGRAWKVGLEREAFFDAFACGRTAQRLAAAAGIDRTICGMCIAACPWTGRYLARCRGTVSPAATESAAPQ